MKNGGRHCQATTKLGNKCQGVAMAGKEYCFFHDKSSRTKRLDASRKGGRNRMAPREIKILSENSPEIPIKSANDVLILISATINQVRTGRLDVRLGNGIGYLSGIALKAIEKGELEERLKALEEKIHNGIGNQEISSGSKRKEYG